jgi:hypothetical protein
MLFETGIRALPQVLPCVVRATGLHYLPNPFFKNIDQGFITCLIHFSKTLTCIHIHGDARLTGARHLLTPTAEWHTGPEAEGNTGDAPQARARQVCNQQSCKTRLENDPFFLRLECFQICRCCLESGRPELRALWRLRGHVCG